MASKIKIGYYIYNLNKLAIQRKNINICIIYLINISIYAYDNGLNSTF